MSYDSEHGEALSYARLEQPWDEWAGIAQRFALAVDGKEDKEDLTHNIIERLAEVAEEYKQKGKPMTRGSCNRVAEYTRLRFYRDKKRWGKVFSVSLNSPIPNSDGETEFLDTVPDERPEDWDTWLDATNHYVNSSKNIKRAIQKLLKGEKMSGHDWRLVKRFRDGF